MAAVALLTTGDWFAFSSSKGEVVHPYTSVYFCSVRMQHTFAQRHTYILPEATTSAQPRFRNLLRTMATLNGDTPRKTLTIDKILEGIEAVSRSYARK